MNEWKKNSLIEKLSRVTQARGATQAEASLAAEKIRQLQGLKPRRPEVYVDGWPGQPKCAHRMLKSVDTRRGVAVCAQCGYEFLMRPY